MGFAPFLAIGGGLWWTKGGNAKTRWKKAELEDLKTWRNYAVTSLLALIAFIFTKSDETSTILLIIVFFAVITLGIAVVVLQLKIKKLIREIGEL